jgi:hypothetical protein
VGRTSKAAGRAAGRISKSARKSSGAKGRKS